MGNSIFKLKYSDYKGFSIVELMIAMVIVLVMLAFITSILSGLNHQFRTQRPRLEVMSNAQMAADTITRLARMSGSRTLNCTNGFQTQAPAASAPLGNGYFAKVRLQSDWNPSDCTLNGIEEDVTFSIKDNTLYLDAAQQVPFVDKISALRFQFFDKDNSLITDPQTRSNDISFIRVEIDTLSDDGTSPTVTSAAKLRK